MKAAWFMIAMSAGFSSVAPAQTLHLAACDHLLILKHSAQATPEILSAPKGANVKLQLEPLGARLLCAPSAHRSEAAASASQSVSISGVRINRGIGPGAQAQQNIGGQHTASRGASGAERIVITVPNTWRLSARSWVGSLQADTGTWQVDVEIAAGEMGFASLKDSRVVIDAGSLTAQSLQGRFDAHVRGAGDINALRSNDAQLHLQLTGAGSMSFLGRAQSAVVRASGVGSIEIEKLATEPKITASGLANIDIGR